MTKRFLFLLSVLALLLPLKSEALNAISLLVTVTNAPTTNGCSITVNSDTRIATNTAPSGSGTFWATNLTKNGSATNLFLQIAANGISSPRLKLAWKDTNSFYLYGASGQALAASSVGSWCSLTLSTNPTTQGWDFRVPITLETATNQTNISSLALKALNDVSTNSFMPGSTAVKHHADLTTSQSLSNKTHFFGQLSNVVVQLLKLGGNGFIEMTNGVAGTGIRFDGTDTNNYALLTRDGDDEAWVSLYSVTNGVITSDPGSSHVGRLDSLVNVAVGLRMFPRMNNDFTPFPFNQPTNLWAAANTFSNAWNQFVLLTSFPGGVNVNGGNHTNVNGYGTSASNFTARGSVSFAAQSQTTIAGDISYPWYELNTLAAGNNISLPIGTNVYVRLSGNTNAAAICGIVGTRDGRPIRFLNGSLYGITLSQSTADPILTQRLIANIAGDWTYAPGEMFDVAWVNADQRWRFSVPTAAGTNFVTTGRSDTNLNVWPSSSNNVPETVNGVVNQNTNLTQWQNSSGTLLAAIGANGSLTVGPSGGAITNILTGSASLNFPSTAAQTCSDLTITVTGAASGDVVEVGVPSGSIGANTHYFGFVSAANTVTVRFVNPSTAAYDPVGPATFKVIVKKF